MCSLTQLGFSPSPDWSGDCSVKLPLSINPRTFEKCQGDPSQIRALLNEALVILVMLLEAVRGASNTEGSQDSSTDLWNRTVGEYCGSGKDEPKTHLEFFLVLAGPTGFLPFFRLVGWLL